MRVLYELILRAYPRAFRDECGDQLRSVFSDLLRDPHLSRSQLAALMLRDLANGLGRPEHRPSRDIVSQSVLFGLIIVAFSIAARAWHPGQYLGFSIVPIPFIAYVPAAFWGARRSASFAGGIWVCVIMGAVSSTMVLWDWLLFGAFPFPDAYTFGMAMLMGVGFCIAPAAIGSIAGSVTAGSRA